MTSEHGPKILLLPSSYLPTMIADMQRIRMLAWDLPMLGWDVDVLFPSTAFQHESCIDTDSGPFFSTGTGLHSVEPRMSAILRALQMRSIGWRALLPLYLMGREVLRKSKFDLVYISTTSFPLFVLGRLWKKEFGVRYVLDFHDPWVKDRSKYLTTRHVFKARISAWLAHGLERFAMETADGIVSVSPEYITSLNNRYRNRCMPWQQAARSETIPFGVSLRDLSLAAAKRAAETGNSRNAEIAIHYVGAGGGIMAKSFGLICRILAVLRASDPDLINLVRIRLFGTTYNWKEGDECFLKQLAVEHGVEDLVAEQPQRVSYRKSLEILSEADGVLILGVDDVGYMPSKLYSYAASGKPLLASLRQCSSAYDTLRETPSLGNLVWFDEKYEMPFEEAREIVRCFLEQAKSRRRFDRTNEISRNTSMEMARRHDELFRRIIRSSCEKCAANNARR